MNLKLYVPRVGTHAANTIAAGAAVVGTWRRSAGEEKVVIDYESNLFQAVNLSAFEQKVLHAAGRHVQNSPTRARMRVQPADVIEVGEVARDGSIISITDQPTLDAWLRSGS